MSHLGPLCVALSSSLFSSSSAAWCFDDPSSTFPPASLFSPSLSKLLSCGSNKRDRWFKCLKHAVAGQTQSKQLHKRRTYLPYALWDIRKHRFTCVVPWNRVLCRVQGASRKPRDPQEAADRDDRRVATSRQSGRDSLTVTEEAEHRHEAY